jgi:hypothetical protein
MARRPARTDESASGRFENHGVAASGFEPLTNGL